MKKIKFVYFMMVLLSVYACKKDQYYLYKDQQRIQFGPEISRIYTTSFNLADTLKPYTFYYQDAKVLQDTVLFDIYAIGGVAKEDRSFTLEQTQVSNVINAEPGKHYIAFNDPKATKNFVIKANTVHTRVPIIILRDASLKTSTVVLKFSVVPDKNFKSGEVSNLWRKIEITDRLSQPAAWNASATQFYYGKYSIVKHQFMIQSTGQRWDQTFMVGMQSDLALFQYWTSTLKINLIDYNRKNPGNPLIDENGELVLFP
jgi:hypothetical protein